MNQYTRWAIAFSALCLICIISFLFFDRPVALWMNGYRDSAINMFFRAITRFGQSEWYLVPGFLTFMVFRKHMPDISMAGLFLFSAVAISGLAADLLKYLLPRARPGVFFHEGMYGFRITPLLHGWDHDWNSFPSGHSATAFSAAAVFSILFPKFRVIFFCIAVLISFSRVAVSEHYVSDVIAGAFLGIGTAVLILNRYSSRNSDEQATSHI
jgi:membrane-associated phospholipid phosphatase